MLYYYLYDLFVWSISWPAKPYRVGDGEDDIILQEKKITSFVAMNFIIPML